MVTFIKIISNFREKTVTLDNSKNNQHVLGDSPGIFLQVINKTGLEMSLSYSFEGDFSNI